LATDFSNFTRYFCSNEQHRRILSPCDEEAIAARASHSNDIRLIDQGNYYMNEDAMPSFFALLSDWLALALAQNVSRMAHSTFSETAQVEFYT
jgi:hypothetical protein